MPNEAALTAKVSSRRKNKIRTDTQFFAIRRVSFSEGTGKKGRIRVWIPHRKVLLHLSFGADRGARRAILRVDRGRGIKSDVTAPNRCRKNVLRGVPCGKKRHFWGSNPFLFERIKWSCPRTLNSPSKVGRALLFWPRSTNEKRAAFCKPLSAISGKTRCDFCRFFKTKY